MLLQIEEKNKVPKPRPKKEFKFELTRKVKREIKNSLTVGSDGQVYFKNKSIASPIARQESYEEDEFVEEEEGEDSSGSEEPEKEESDGNSVNLYSRESLHRNDLNPINPFKRRTLAHSLSPKKTTMRFSSHEANSSQPRSKAEILA